MFGLALLLSTVASATVLTQRAPKPLDDCPGYKVHNVRDKHNSLTADLHLAGKPCNTYGKDIKHLKLKVEYQSGMFPNTASDLYFVSQCYI